MTVNDVYKWLDAIAPFETQDAYDNSGMLAGSPSAEVHRILFTLDVTRPAVAEAGRIGAELIVSHHPLMFQPVQKLLYDQGEGAVIRTLAASGISLIAAHTNLDQCAGGVADSLAEALGLEAVATSAQSPYLRTGELKTPCTAKEFLSFVDRSLSACTRLYGDPDALIRRVAVAPGADGGDVAHVADGAFLTGEIKHHELLDAMDRGLTVFDTGHYPTEFPGVAALHKRFVAAASENRWAVEASLYTRPPYPCRTHG